MKKPKKPQKIISVLQSISCPIDPGKEVSLYTFFNDCKKIVEDANGTNPKITLYLDGENYIDGCCHYPALEMTYETLVSNIDYDKQMKKYEKALKKYNKLNENA